MWSQKRSNKLRLRLSLGTPISPLPHAVKDTLEQLLGQETSPPNMSVVKLKSGATS